MSWWDTSGFTSLASQALKNAQKKIDKVLDIDEGAAGKKKGLQPSSTVAKKDEDESQEGAQDGEFWSAWLGSGGRKSKEVEDNTTKPSFHSSWGHPWNMIGSTSEHLEADVSSETKPQVDEIPEDRFQKSYLCTPASEISSLSSVSAPETTAIPSAAAVKDTEPEHSSSETSEMPPEIDKHITHTEQKNVLSSDSFTTDWQDFPLDTDIPEPEENFPLDDGISRLQDHESSQTSEEKIDLIPSTRSIGESVDLEISNQKAAAPDIVFSVETGQCTFVSTNGAAVEDDKNKVNLQSVHASSQSLNKSTQNVTVVLPSPAHVIYFDNNILQEQTLLQEPELFRNSYLPSIESFPVEKSNELNLKHGDLSSKTSSSSSFIAMSEESVQELVPSQSSSLIGSEILPQGSSTPVGETQSESSVTAHTDSKYTSDLSAAAYLDEEYVPVSSNTSQHQVYELTGLTSESSTVTKNETKLSEHVLPEPMFSSDYQKSQSDYMQEYVNISTFSDTSQTVSCDGSAILSDDLHTSNELDMGNSRTSSDLDLPAGGRTSSTGSSDTSKFDSSIDTVVDRSVLDSQSDVDLMEKDPPYSLFVSSQTGGNEVDASGVNQLRQLDDSSHSLSSSYVKCMIEEAMEDLSKTEDSGSDNHSNGEKSESSKVDSELEKSVYSGHESSDEIETTTSSDIEIISAPTPNGDNQYHIPFDLLPLKIALQRTGRDQDHHRSDSQSSSSAHSKAGEMDRMSPERGEGVSWRDDDFHHHDLHAVREEGVDNPSSPERLLKKLAEMAEVLQARENKLVQLSKENHQLTEDNNILRNQLQQSEDARELENADLAALTEEFASRIGDSEKRLQAISKVSGLLVDFFT